MEHFHHRLMAKGLPHGKAVLAMWVMAFSCSLVAIAAAYGKGDQLVAIFVFFGMGGFILLRYLGYFRFEFFGQSFLQFWKIAKIFEHPNNALRMQNHYLLIFQVSIVLCDVLEKAAEGIQFKEAKISFFEENGKFGSRVESVSNKVGKVVSWKDPDLTGYYSRDDEFIAEFPISGRNYNYGKVVYKFLDKEVNLRFMKKFFWKEFMIGYQFLLLKFGKIVSPTI